jgi:hypothetical protein
MIHKGSQGWGLTLFPLVPEFLFPIPVEMDGEFNTFNGIGAEIYGRGLGPHM